MAGHPSGNDSNLLGGGTVIERQPVTARFRRQEGIPGAEAHMKGSGGDMFRSLIFDHMHRWRMGVAAAVCFLALAWIGASSVQLWHPSPSATRLPPLGDGIFSGVFVAGAAAAAVGAIWLCVGWVTVRRTLTEERRRFTSVQQVLVSTTRDQRERMHELRSTVAGLVSGSALLDSPEVPLETRRRLLDSVRRELDRMDRLLSGHAVAPADFDLDDALTQILDLQRLKGRRVEFRSNGDAVHARFDALAEVVNILMDNAATHGGTDASLVEVVRRDEETVDITVSDSGHGIPPDERDEVFEWGRRGSTSSGEGIGLHLARRLMTEDGGSLRLADDQGDGSSFVISLPAARRSTENFSTQEDRRARLRSG